MRGTCHLQIQHLFTETTKLVSHICIIIDQIVIAQGSSAYTVTHKTYEHIFVSKVLTGKPDEEK